MNTEPTDKTFTVLFIDDDRDFLDAQATYFRSRGHTVHTAENSREALELLETIRPDLVFVDLMIEHYDSGFQLVYKIRKDPRLADTPLVMLSAVARGTGQRFDREGQTLLEWSRLDRFVDKPVSARQLLSLAQELLASRTVHEDTEAAAFPEARAATENQEHPPLAKEQQ